MTSPALPFKFYCSSPTEVAKALLGKYLVRKLNKDILIGKIIETEAYLNFEDEAAHSFKSGPKRKQSLSNPPGHTYVHAMRHHSLLDILVQDGSVLIRALEPIEGIDLMKEFRKTTEIENLTNGPGKLCQAFQITRTLNGIDVTSPDSEINVLEGEKVPEESIKISKRIGISKSKDLELRFFI